MIRFSCFRLRPSVPASAASCSGSESELDSEELEPELVREEDEAELCVEETEVDRWTTSLDALVFLGMFEGTTIFLSLDPQELDEEVDEDRGRVALDLSVLDLFHEDGLSRNPHEGHRLSSLGRFVCPLSQRQMQSPWNVCPHFRTCSKQVIDSRHSLHLDCCGCRIVAVLGLRRHCAHVEAVAYAAAAVEEEDRSEVRDTFNKFCSRRILWLGSCLRPPLKETGAAAERLRRDSMSAAQSSYEVSEKEEEEESDERSSEQMETFRSLLPLIPLADDFESLLTVDSCLLRMDFDLISGGPRGVNGGCC